MRNLVRSDHAFTSSLLTSCTVSVPVGSGSVVHHGGKATAPLHSNYREDAADNFLLSRVVVSRCEVLHCGASLLFSVMHAVTANDAAHLSSWTLSFTHTNTDVHDGLLVLAL